MNSLPEASEVYEQVKDGTQLDLIIYHIQEAIKSKQKSVTFSIPYPGLTPENEKLLKDKGYSWSIYRYEKRVDKYRARIETEITIKFTDTPGLITI